MLPSCSLYLPFLSLLRTMLQGAFTLNNPNQRPLFTLGFKNVSWMIRSPMDRTKYRCEQPPRCILIRSLHSTNYLPRRSGTHLHWLHIFCSVNMNVSWCVLWQECNSRCRMWWLFWSQCANVWKTGEEHWYARLECKKIINICCRFNVFNVCARPFVLLVEVT